MSLKEEFIMFLTVYIKLLMKNKYFYKIHNKKVLWIFSIISQVIIINHIILMIFSSILRKI
jgi:hypothetical protein